MKKFKSFLSLFRLLFKKRRHVKVRLNRLNLTRSNDADFLRYAESIHHTLAAHAAYFPSPPTDAIEAAMNEMNEALLAYENNSARATYHSLAAARARLRKQLRSVVSYCLNEMSNDKFILAGFGRRKSGKKRG